VLVESCEVSYYSRTPDTKPSDRSKSMSACSASSQTPPSSNHSRHLSASISQGGITLRFTRLEHLENALGLLGGGAAGLGPDDPSWIMGLPLEIEPTGAWSCIGGDRLDGGGGSPPRVGPVGASFCTGGAAGRGLGDTGESPPRVASAGTSTRTGGGGGGAAGRKLGDPRGGVARRGLGDTGPPRVASAGTSTRTGGGGGGAAG
jgi:hypothetical protein